MSCDLHLAPECLNRTDVRAVRLEDQVTLDVCVHCFLTAEDKNIKLRQEADETLCDYEHEHAPGEVRAPR